VSGADDVRAELAAAADRRRAEAMARYLQVRPGGYGEGDRVLGVTVPAQRTVAGRHWRALPLEDVAELLHSRWHEERLTALIVMVRKYGKGNDDERRAIVELMLANTVHINNWDLVDSSAPYILGPWLVDRDSSVLDRLAGSDLIWERRIAIMATFAFIRAGRFDRSLTLAARLLHDDEDLIQKAVGWMLREIGNRDRPVEEAFLMEHSRAMPRTMLRYAIEKFPAPLRAAYLAGEVAPG
jgi:3-methyladenine DNA glycosylase AlkD